MTVKTILVHLADDEDHPARLRLGMRLAREHGAHLTALFITSPSHMPAGATGRGASAAYIEAAHETALKIAEELEREFSGKCQSAGIEYDWVVAEGDHLDLLTRQAHAADLIIVSQPEQRFLEDRFRMRLPEQLVLNAGLPVLILPRGQEPSTVGHTIVVAWKGTREAVRAVRDALPLLTSADRVIVVSVGPTPEESLSEEEVVDHLKRHGVKAEARQLEETEAVSKALLEVAREEGADLIVLGAYGHSRLREIVLGGVTRQLINRSELPVLMSH